MVAKKIKSRVRWAAGKGTGNPTWSGQSKIAYWCANVELLAFANMYNMAKLSACGDFQKLAASMRNFTHENPNPWQTMQT
jgi:hypothetical protein